MVVRRDHVHPAVRCPPFYDDNQSELFNTIRKGGITTRVRAGTRSSRRARNVIDNLLKLDPTVRSGPRSRCSTNPWVASVARLQARRALQGEHDALQRAAKVRAAGIMSLQVLNFMAKGAAASASADMVERRRPPGARCRGTRRRRRRRRAAPGLRGCLRAPASPCPSATSAAPAVRCIEARRTRAVINAGLGRDACHARRDYT